MCSSASKHRCSYAQMAVLALSFGNKMTLNIDDRMNDALLIIIMSVGCTSYGVLQRSICLRFTIGTWLFILYVQFASHNESDVVQDCVIASQSIKL